MNVGPTWGGDHSAGWVPDPVGERASQALDTLFYTVVASPDATPPPLDVAVTGEGDILILRHDDITLTFERIGRQANAGVPPNPQDSIDSQVTNEASLPPSIVPEPSVSSR